MFWHKKTSVKDLLPPPVRVEHGEYSMILSAHDDRAKANTDLIDLSLKAIESVRHIDLRDVSARLPKPPYFPDIWPGEHYKLLAGFMRALRPHLAIEIGTSTGISALSMRSQGVRLVTYDIRPWQSYPDTVLQDVDFTGDGLSQIVGDLGELSFFQTQRELLMQADWIFIDATHDGLLEKKLLNLLATLPFPKAPFILFDDIRVWTMLRMWRDIEYPKLDLTSFGHWSGTGLIQLI